MGLFATLTREHAASPKPKRQRRAVLPKEAGDPCWDGYVQRGTKVKNGQTMPNCVPQQPEQASLVDALSDLAAELENNGYKPELVRDVAAEYKLNPKLLERKFEEQHKLTPEAYSRIKQERNLALQTGAAANVDTALRMAREAYQNNYRRGGPGEAHVGKLFEFRGEQLAFVAFNGARTVDAIRVKRRERVTIRNATRDILEQLRRQGVVETAAASFVCPPAVAKQARKGLELRKANGGKGGTSVGVSRANQLANRKGLSFNTVKRMKAYFDRHQVDKQGKDWNNKNKPSKGKIAWLCWGGDAGWAWAKKIVAQHAKETASEETMTVQNLIQRHAAPRASETAVHTIPIVDHYLHTSEFMGRARKAAGLLGLDWLEGERVGDGQSIGSNQVQVKGKRGAINQFKRWLADHKPTEIASLTPLKDQRSNKNKGNITVTNNHLLTNEFAKRARGMARSLGLSWDKTFDVEHQTGIARKHVTVTGTEANVEHFKRWVDGNKPKEESERASADTLVALHYQITPKDTTPMNIKSLIARHAETAAAKPNWKEHLNAKEVAEYEQIAKAVGAFTGYDYWNWLGVDGVDNAAAFKRFHKAVQAYLGKDLADQAEVDARLDDLLVSAVKGKAPSDSLTKALYGEWKKAQKGKGAETAALSVSALIREHACTVDELTEDDLEPEEAAGADWWAGLSKAQQAAYLKKHPKSKFAKAAGKAGRGPMTQRQKSEAQNKRSTTKLRAYKQIDSLFKDRNEYELKGIVQDKKTLSKVRKYAQSALDDLKTVTPTDVDKGLDKALKSKDWKTVKDFHNKNNDNLTSKQRADVLRFLKDFDDDGNYDPE